MVRSWISDLTHQADVRHPAAAAAVSWRQVLDFLEGRGEQQAGNGRRLPRVPLRRARL
jgi:hypothetical protein